MTDVPNDGELYRLIEALDKKIDDVLIQVRYTNGRMTDSEKREQFRDGQFSIIKWLVTTLAAGLISLFVAVSKKWIG